MGAAPKISGIPADLPLKRALVIEDDEGLRASIRFSLVRMGFEVHESASCSDARGKLHPKTGRLPFEIVFVDLHLPDGDGLQLLAGLPSDWKSPQCPWVFVTADFSPELLEKVIRAGGSELVLKPFRKEEFQAAIRRVQSVQGDPTGEVMRQIEQLTGIELREDKRELVRSRLLQRAVELGLSNESDYLVYFRERRNEELPAIVSLVSTHVTSFFRDPEHFDVLHDLVLPDMTRTFPTVRLWSAACSTGEEVYSAAMTCLEFLRERGVSSERTERARFEFLGTDLDPRSVETARNGVYSTQSCSGIRPDLLSRWFSAGSGALAGYHRVHDDLHRLCRFEPMNLLSPVHRHRNVNIVFIRHALMYFRQEVALDVLRRLSQAVIPGGFIFLSNSEEALGLKLGLEPVARSVYRVPVRRG